MITDKTKLIGLLKIEVSNLGNYLDDIINQKEPELLEDWFGYELAKDIQAATPSTEAQALIDGFEYTDSDGYLKQIKPLSEILAYFIYFYFVRDNQTFESTVGAVSELAENAIRATPVNKLVRNYNRGTDLINEMIEYVFDNEDDYPDAIYNGYNTYITTLGI